MVPLQTPYHRGIRYIRYLPGRREPRFAKRWSLRTELVRILAAPLTTATRAPTSSRVRIDSSASAALCKCRQCSSAALCRDHAAAPLFQSPARKPPASAKKNNSKRDILRRTAMHASHRRELLVPRERRRPVESQRASSYTPREFMAVQKRRFFVLRMASHPHP